ncbi:hypothetical protein ACFQYP_25455 [Nonomuraea antimicrobica]
MYVKICGLSEPEHVATAVEAGADAIGFVLTRSPRRVTPERAAELAALVPGHVLTVGVFRGEDPETVRRRCWPRAYAASNCTASTRTATSPP